LIDAVLGGDAELLKWLDGREVSLGKQGKRTIHTAQATSQEFEMSWGQRVLHFLANPNIATLLMTLGMLCVYLELTTPGAIVPGVVGAIAIVVAFMSFQMLPIRAGGLILLVLGMGLLLAEPFVTSNGVFALGGVISFVLGALWVLDPHETTLRVSPAIWIPAALALGGGAGTVAYFVMRSRRAPPVDALAGLKGYEGRIEWVGEGALSGKVLLRGETWEFESHEPVRVGDRVTVSSVHGMKVKVRVAHAGSKGPHAGQASEKI
jgi:membrane-bound serine protease (ClpP class)